MTTSASPIKTERGFFIVFEGIDGSGKTVHTSLLKEFLDEKGFKTILLREPTNGPWGKKIRASVLNREKNIAPNEALDLFIKDRKENIATNIVPALEENKIIIQDRYYFSTIAYQGAQGIEPDYIRKMNEDFAVKPDLVFYLKIKPDVGLQRIDKGRNGKRDVFESKGYLEKVKDIFDSFDNPYIKNIDGSLPLETIQQNIRDITIGSLSTIVK